MPDNPNLKRTLTLIPTTAIVIGAVIGSGIFATPSGMARVLGDVQWLLLIWFCAGMLTIFGAMTQCELVSQMPKTGGLYEYLRTIYGEQFGFLYGWANFTIAGTGAAAAIAIIFASYLGEFVTLPHLSPELEGMPVHIPLLGDIFPLDDIGAKIIASAVIVCLVLVNIRGVKFGATLQTISTSAKVIAIAAIVCIAFVGGGSIGDTANWSGTTGAAGGLEGWKLVGAIATAMTGAFWSYDGWGNAAIVGGEVKNPTKTIPRAIILGTIIFISLYLLMNLAYFYILPIDSVAAAPNDRVASEMVKAVIGAAGAGLVAALIMLSTFDTTNSTILTNSRIYYAMARDKVFTPSAGKVHSEYQTPHVALILMGAWSVILIFTGSFSLLLDMYIFVNWLIYVTMAIGVFVLRRRHPNAERPFSVPGYPIVPIVFILFAVAYVALTLVTDIQAYQAGERPILQSVMGIILVLSGLPFYYFWKYKRETN